MKKVNAKGLVAGFVLMALLLGNLVLAPQAAQAAAGVQFNTAVTLTDNLVALKGKTVTVTRELEGGLEEMLKIELPAVLTIQTGINEPRYVSIMGIRKVRAKEIPVLDPAAIGLAPGETGANANLIKCIGLAVPPAGKEAEWIKGTPAEIARRILDIVKERGGVA